VVDGTQREKAEVEMGHGWRVGMGKKFTSTPLALCGEREKQKWKWVMDGAWEWVKNLQVLLSLSAVKEKSRSGNGSWMARGNG
jgi:hypothetical protein